MYPENANDPVLNLRGEKPFEPTNMELRKQFNTLDAIIRLRSTKLKEENDFEESNKRDDDNDGFLPPYNSAF